MNPHQVTQDFEAALCEYAGAPYAVAVNSCTSALLLACAWQLQHGVAQPFSLPKRTYVSVPMSVIHAGGSIVFRDAEWRGMYQLAPYPVWDSARWFESGIYGRLRKLTHQHPEMGDTHVCVSFHASKTLGLEQGGAILHDDHEADAWYRRARFDGRTSGVAPKDDKFPQIGWHCYMNPSTAAQGILKLHSLPRHNDPLPNDDYPDLSKIAVFNNWRDDL